MRKLIGALLELARLDAGQEPMKRLRFDFSRTVAECVELVKPLADEHDVKYFPKSHRRKSPAIRNAWHRLSRIC